MNLGLEWLITTSLVQFKDLGRSMYLPVTARPVGEKKTAGEGRIRIAEMMPGHYSGGLGV